MIPILNYTTKMSVDSTINELQKILAKAKANAIFTEYGADALPVALSFRVDVGGGSIVFRLPVDIDGVTRALKADKAYRDDAHARRVAWRIAKDWVEAQMALIQAQMAELPQVFLPYAQAGDGETLYARIKSGGFLQLTGPKMTNIRHCQRPDCGQPLGPNAAHNARFCSEVCRRTVRQREVYADAALMRAARKNAEAASKRESSDG